MEGFVYESYRCHAGSSRSMFIKCNVCPNSVSTSIVQRFVEFIIKDARGTNETKKKQIYEKTQIQKVILGKLHKNVIIQNGKEPRIICTLCGY